MAAAVRQLSDHWDAQPPAIDDSVPIRFVLTADGVFGPLVFYAMELADGTIEIIDVIDHPDYFTDWAVHLPDD